MTDTVSHLFGRLSRVLGHGRPSFAERWYKEEPTIQISDHRKEELRKKGFIASTDFLFDFDRYGYDKYVNLRDYRQLHPINGTFSRLIDSKAFIPILLRTNPEWLPDLCVVSKSDRLCYVIGLGGSYHKLEDVLPNSLEQYGKLFAKPCSGSGGKGAFIIEKSNLSQSLKDLHSSKALFLIQNMLEPDPYSFAIYPRTINTMRVLFFKSKQGEMRILRIIHRFGTDESYPVDNCGRGGMAFPVHKGTGVFGTGVIYASRTRNGWHGTHCDSGVQVTGMNIPGWTSKLRDIRELLDALSFLDYGGLDLAPTESGLKLLEINSLPELRLSQLEGPLLLDEQFADFLKSKGYRC